MEIDFSNKTFQIVLMSFLGMLITIIDRKPDMITAVCTVLFVISAGMYMTTTPDDPPEE